MSRRCDVPIDVTVGYVGPQGPKGDRGDPGTDAAVTQENVGRALVAGRNVTIDHETATISAPSNVSAFANDAGYLTEHQSLAAYELAEDHDRDMAAKQDSLVAGHSIEMDGTTISVRRGLTWGDM